MIFFSLPNVASSVAERRDITSAPVNARPEFKTKEDYRRWCANSKTQHSFISQIEGVQPGTRVSDANPPALIHGLTLEYDAELISEWAARVQKVAPAGLCPIWGCRSFSGHGRLFFPFEHPLRFVDAELWKEFTKIAFAELKAKRLLAGFEEGESADLSHYFELGTDWTQIPGGQPVPASMAEGWLSRAVLKVNWSEKGKALPIERLRAEAERRFPGRWPGGWAGFNVGARGVRFWDANADAAAVLVTETGCVCFTGDRGFVSWAEIFGPDFVRHVADDILGEAIQGIFVNPSNNKYWRHTAAAGWQPWGKEDIRLLLAARGLRRSRRPGEPLSEVEQALFMIHQTKVIDGVFPAFFRKEEIIYCNQARFLNTSKVQLLKPADGTHSWGQDFPWVSNYLTQIFRGQRAYYLAWFAHYYRSALAGKPERGLSLFIAGPPNVGKTFLNNAVHKQIFGAAGEATSYLTGDDQFNGVLFGCPIWTVDDAIASTDARTKARFSQVVKAITANDEFTMRAMYREGLRMPWLGRLVVTMNDDPESLQMLPSTETNLMDKIMLLRANPTDLQFPSDEQIMIELPHYTAFLRDMVKDPEIWVGGRFGIKAYHDPDLRQAAEDSQDTTSAKELIGQWAKHHFGKDGPGASATEWRGNPTNLISEFSHCEDTKELAARLMPTAVVVGRFLNKLINRGEPWIRLHRTGSERTYSISRQAAGLHGGDGSVTEPPVSGNTRNFLSFKHVGTKVTV